MTTTLPTPSHGLEYTNSETGDKFKYDSDAGAWEGFEGIDESGDSMTGTIAYPDMLINRNTLTADPLGSGTFASERLGEWEYLGNMGSSITYVADHTDEDGNYYAAKSYTSSVVVTSKDLVNWSDYGTISAGSAKTYLKILTDGKGNFGVAGGNNYNVPMYFYGESTDGLNYAKYNATSTSGSGYVYGWQYLKEKDLFFWGEQAGHIFVSTDGCKTIRKITLPNNGDHGGIGDIQSIAWHKDRYVMVSGRSWAWWSKDLSQWNKVDLSDVFAGSLKGDSLVSTKNVTSNGEYCLSVVSYKDEDTFQVIKTVDGANWSHLSSPDNVNNTDRYGEDVRGGLQWFGGRWYLGGGIYNGNARLWTSLDGVDWEEVDIKSITGHQFKWNTRQLFKIRRNDGIDELVYLSKDGHVARLLAESDITPPQGSNLYFNDDPVIVDKGQTRALAKSVSGLSSLLGSSRYYQAEEPSDSFGIDNGTLWLNPSNAKLSIYYDSDWNQLN